ncbi:uncharacterized transmembrane protein [Tanacetum coccineum]|uniref:Uncharacterized transmembrane protein n=1 Tax=Tanacetum coccineum TaxID=301880 RepID=A0ABQ4ZM01_9ASTR
MPTKKPKVEVIMANKQQTNDDRPWQKHSNKPSWTPTNLLPMNVIITSLNGVPHFMVGVIFLGGAGNNFSSGSGTSNVPLKTLEYESNTEIKKWYKSDLFDEVGLWLGSLPKTVMRSYTYVVVRVVMGNYNTSKSQNLGGPSMKSGGIGGGGNKDPFGGLVDFSAKGSGGMKTGNKTNVGIGILDDLDLVVMGNQGVGFQSKKEQLAADEDWGFDSEDGGGGAVGGTTELKDFITDVELGEYKKAVADLFKVLEQDGKNVSVLVQRALLYESMEKYKLGAEDLRTVMNIDPGNRVARSTIHRLTKLAS